MIVSFYQKGWEDYVYWQSSDKKMLKKVNELIRQCCRTPFEGLGHPEPLKENLSGLWSRRINQEHRLVYKVENEVLYVFQCRKHY